MNFEHVLRQNCCRTEELLKKITDSFAENLVNQAIKYSLLDGGKRLRPSLVFETARLFGVDDENIERLAVAIEMIHTYSLIHDDLPCMDDDDFRRGKPSCHKKYGEAIAVLAGDGLLNLAMETLLCGKYSQNYFKAIKFVFDCSGIFGMIGGQAIDILPQKTNDFETLDFLTENKTAKLIMACIGSTAIYCNATDEQKDNLLVFAENFGKAFQVADDLLDADIDQNLSYTNLLGRDGAKSQLQQYSQTAIDCISKFSNSQFFQQLCNFNLTRDH